jgi:hypothetical protein
VGGVDFGTVTKSGRGDTLDFIETMKAAATMTGTIQLRIHGVH